MSFSCQDAFTFMRGEACRRIAYDQTRSAPAVDPDDVLQEAAANLWQRLRSANGPCPTPKDCPLNRGRGRGLCPFPLDDDNLGERYVKIAVLNAARGLRKAGTRSTNVIEEDPDETTRRVRVETPTGDVDAVARAAGPASRGDNPLDFLGQAEFREWAPKLLDRFLAERGRIAGDERSPNGELPHRVFPGIGRTKVQEKLAAVEDVLRMEARDAAEGLRMADPHFYGSLEAGTGIENKQAKNTERHSQHVNSILWQIWRAEMGDEA